jgi:hypothetical protein
MAEAERVERLEQDLTTWRLVASIAATAPVDWVIETHGGGGQYDTVEIHLASATIVRMNRGGSVHVADPVEGDRQRDLVGELRAGMDLSEAVAWITASGAPNDAVAAAADFMFEALDVADALEDGRSWTWQNGRLDSTEGAGRREHLFGPLPTAMHACKPTGDDLFDQPEYRYWFLTVDDRPVLAVDHRQAVVFTTAAARDLTEHPTASTDALDVIVGNASRTPAQVAAAARPAFRAVAEDLAARLVSGLIRFEPGLAMSAYANWFTDEKGSVLMAVVGAHEAVDAVDEVLAYALAWQGDADLVLVLPEGRMGLTLERLPFIATPVRIFTYTSDLHLSPTVIPAPAEILQMAATRPLRATSPHDLGGTQSLWVEDLIKTADEHWALVHAHRATYRAWHCRGRQVLRIERVKPGLKITAGVDYSKPGNGQAAADQITLSEPLSPELRARVEARVATAVHDRFSGTDTGHVEHRMQAALAASGLDQLGLKHFAREYPAWRGEGRPGYVDFLGLDKSNRLHIVETKVGTGDVKGVLQTLDYATWVAAHADAIRADLGWDAGPVGPEIVALDFVLAPKGPMPAVGPYFAGQVEAITGSIPWRVFIVSDPMADTPIITPHPTRSTPTAGPLVAEPVRPPRWAASTGAAITEAT